MAKSDQKDDGQQARKAVTVEMAKLKEACFSVFYLMSENLEVAKDATFIQWVFGYTVLFMDFGQLVANLVDASFGWSDDAVYHASLVNIAYLLRLQQMEFENPPAARAVSFVCNMIVLVALCITSVVISEFKAEKFQRVWAAKLLRFLYGGNEASAVAALFGALFSSIFEFGIAPLKCTFWEGVLVPEGAYCTSFDFPRIIFSVPIVLLAIFHTIFSTLSTLFFVDINPLSPVPLATFSGRTEAAFVVFRAVAIVLPLFNRNYPGFNGCVLLVFSILLLMDFVYSMPYHRSVVNYVRAGMLGCTSWLCCMSLAVVYTKNTFIPHMMLLPGSILCASLAIALCRYRKVRISRIATKIAVSVKSLAKAMRRRRLVKLMLEMARQLRRGVPMDENAVFTPRAADASAPLTPGPRWGQQSPRQRSPKMKSGATPLVKSMWHSDEMDAQLMSATKHETPTEGDAPPPISLPPPQKMGLSDVVQTLMANKEGGTQSTPRALFLGERDNTEYIEPNLTALLTEWIEEQKRRKTKEIEDLGLIKTPTIADSAGAGAGAAGGSSTGGKLNAQQLLAARSGGKGGRGDGKANGVNDGPSSTTPKNGTDANDAKVLKWPMDAIIGSKGLLENKSRSDCVIILQLLLTVLSTKDDDRCSTWLASFTHFVLGDQQLALDLLEMMTAGRDSWIDMDYFHFAVRQNIKQRAKSRELGGRLVSTIGLMELTKEHEQARQYHYDTIRNLRSYWDNTCIARRTESAVTYLNRFVSSVRNAEMAFVALALQWPNSAQLLRSHARFLADVKNDKDGARFLDRKATRIESGLNPNDDSDFDDDDEDRTMSRSVMSGSMSRASARMSHASSLRSGGSISLGSQLSSASGSVHGAGHASWRDTILADEVKSLRTLYSEVFSVIIWLLILATVGLVVIDLVLFSGSAQTSLTSIFEVSSLRTDLVRLMFRVRDLSWASYDRDQAWFDAAAADIEINAGFIQANLTAAYLTATGPVAAWYANSDILVHNPINSSSGEWSLQSAPPFQTIDSIGRRVRSIRAAPMDVLDTKEHRAVDLTAVWDLQYVVYNSFGSVLRAMESLMQVLVSEVNAFVQRARLGVALNAVLNATLAVFIVSVVTRSISSYVLHFRTATIITAISLHLLPQTRTLLQKHYRELEKSIRSQRAAVNKDNANANDTTNLDDTVGSPPVRQNDPAPTSSAVQTFNLGQVLRGSSGGDMLSNSVAPKGQNKARLPQGQGSDSIDRWIAATPSMGAGVTTPAHGNAQSLGAALMMEESIQSVPITTATDAFSSAVGEDGFHSGLQGGASVDEEENQDGFEDSLSPMPSMKTAKRTGLTLHLTHQNSVLDIKANSPGAPDVLTPGPLQAIAQDLSFKMASSPPQVPVPRTSRMDTFQMMQAVMSETPVALANVEKEHKEVLAQRSKKRKEKRQQAKASRDDTLAKLSEAAEKVNKMHMTPVRRAMLQSSLFLIGIVVFGVCVHMLVLQVVIGSQRFTDIVEMKDLIADLLPPPGYIIEAFSMTLTVVQQLRAGATMSDIEASIDELWFHEQVYFDRSRYWKDALEAGPLREEMAVKAREPAMAFFKLAREEFVPAARQRDLERSTMLATQLEELFSVHVTHIVNTVSMAEDEFVAAESVALGVLQTFEYAMLITGIVLFLFMAAVTLVFVTNAKEAQQRRTLFGYKVPKLPVAVVGAVYTFSIVVYFVVAFQTGQAAIVDGPSFAHMMAMKDLIADIVPPPAYLIEAYLHMSRMVSDLNAPGGINHVEVKVHTDRIATNHQEYMDRQDHWVNNLFEGIIRESLIVGSYEPAVELLSEYETLLLPAIASGNKTYAVNLIDHALSGSFSLHRANVVRTVDLSIQRAEMLQAEAIVAVPLAWITCLAVAISCVLIVLFVVWALRSEGKSNNTGGQLKAVAIVSQSSATAADILRDVTVKLKRDTKFHMRPSALWSASVALLFIIMLIVLLPLRYLPIVQNLASLSNQAGRLVSTSSRCIYMARELGVGDPYVLSTDRSKRLALQQCVKELKDVYEGVRLGGEFGISMGVEAFNQDIEDMLIKEQCFSVPNTECAKASGAFAHARRSGLNFLMNFIVDLLEKLLADIEAGLFHPSYESAAASSELQFLAFNFNHDLFWALQKISAMLKQQASDIFTDIHTEQRVLYGVYIFFAFVCFFLGLIRYTVMTLHKELSDAMAFVSILPPTVLSPADAASLRGLLSSQDAQSDDEDVAAPVVAGSGTDTNASDDKTKSTRQRLQRSNSEKSGFTTSTNRSSNSGGKGHKSRDPRDRNTSAVRHRSSKRNKNK